jgi:hypothetical protein
MYGGMKYPYVAETYIQTEISHLSVEECVSIFTSPFELVTGRKEIYVPCVQAPAHNEDDKLPSSWKWCIHRYFRMR